MNQLKWKLAIAHEPERYIVVKDGETIIQVIDRDTGCLWLNYGNDLWWRVV